MRWFWIDRFTEFDSGRHATAIKNVSLAEEHLHDHFPGAPVMPNSLIIEGHGADRRAAGGRARRLRGAGGAGQDGQGHGFTFRPCRATRSPIAATIDDIHKDGAIVSGTSHVGDRLQGEVQIFFAHLHESSGRQVAVRSGQLAGHAQAVGRVRRRPRRARPAAASPRRLASRSRRLTSLPRLNHGSGFTRSRCLPTRGTSTMRRRVVITGMGCITPHGHRRRAASGTACKNGASGVGYTTVFDASRFPTKISAEVRDWDVSDVGEDPEAWKLRGRHTQLRRRRRQDKRSRDSGMLDAQLDPDALRRLSGQRRRPAGFRLLHPHDDQRAATATSSTWRCSPRPAWNGCTRRSSWSRSRTCRPGTWPPCSTPKARTPTA